MNLFEDLALLEAKAAAAEYHHGEGRSRDTYWSRVGYRVASGEDPEAVMADERPDGEAS